MQDMRAKVASQLATGELQSLLPRMQPLDIDADKFAGLRFSQVRRGSLRGWAVSVRPAGS